MSLSQEKKMVYPEVVEISDDEDAVRRDDGQPESSRRTFPFSPSAKRTIIIDDTDDSEEDDVPETQLDMYYRYLEPPRLKRQKLDFGADLGIANATLEPDNFKVVAEDFRQLPDFIDDDLVSVKGKQPLPEFEQGNEHAPLTFRILAPLNVPTPVEVGKLSDADQKKDCSTTTTEDKEDTALEIAPYYFDNKLQARMYRGLGYEKFPIHLGTIPEHVEICDEWDRKQANKFRRQVLKQIAHQNGSDLDVNKAMEYGELMKDTVMGGESEYLDDVMESECLERIREVLPDIQHKFAIKKIRDHAQAFQSSMDDEIKIQPDATVIISQILELPDYPKQEKPDQSNQPAADGTGITIKCQKSDNVCKSYQKDAVCILAAQFDLVPTHFIHKVVQEKQSLFDSYLHIHELNAKYDGLPSRDRPFRRYLNPRLQIEKKYACKDHQWRPENQWRNLVNEVQAAKQKVCRDDLHRIKLEEHETAEKANLQAHKDSGNLIVCQCCFDEETPINRAVCCNNIGMHWFCFSCVLLWAENQVGSMKHEMRCMHESGCKSSLSEKGVRQAIPPKLFDKLAFYQQQFEITAACLEGLEQCPFCDFKAICDPIEESSIFQCQNPECQRVSCRKCYEDSHLPKTCEEVKVDRRLSARHQVEEARSEAMIRTCPQCKVKIVKEIGCNKMKCSKCGCVMCYVCKTDISRGKDGGYGHFNEPGAKCILYDKDFNRHEAEADEAEKEAIKKVQAEDGDIDEKQLQIETGTGKQKSQPKMDELGLGWGGAFPPRAPLPPGPLRAPPRVRARRYGDMQAVLGEHHQRHLLLMHQQLQRREPILNGLMPANNMLDVENAQRQEQLRNVREMQEFLAMRGHHSIHKTEPVGDQPNQRVAQGAHGVVPHPTLHAAHALHFQPAPLPPFADLYGLRNQQTYAGLPAQGNDLNAFDGLREPAIAPRVDVTMNQIHDQPRIDMPNVHDPVPPHHFAQYLPTLLQHRPQINRDELINRFLDGMDGLDWHQQQQHDQIHNSNRQAVGMNGFDPFDGLAVNHTGNPQMHGNHVEAGANHDDNMFPNANFYNMQF